MTLAHDLPHGVTRARHRSRAHDSPALPAAPWRRALRATGTLLHQRLVQFAVLGGLIFAIAPRARSPEDIDIRSERLAALHVAEAARSGSRALPPEVGAEVDQRALEDEILYREGVRLGLDTNDGIVRQRVVQKVLFLAEEMAGASRPADEAGLRAFFENNRERWAIPERIRFAQIYRHSPEALRAWAEGPQTDAPPAGEPSPVGAELDVGRTQIAETLGAGFAEAVAAAPEGRWSGPIASAYGWHLVRVLSRRPARQAELAEVRDAVLEAYSVFRRQEATAAFLSTAFARYRVAVDGRPLQRFTPSKRIAFRSVASGED
jgi:peptidyl-prolyl cis-trans isomerase C